MRGTHIAYTEPPQLPMARVADQSNVSGAARRGSRSGPSEWAGRGIPPCGVTGGDLVPARPMWTHLRRLLPSANDGAPSGYSFMPASGASRSPRSSSRASSSVSSRSEFTR